MDNQARPIVANIDRVEDMLAPRHNADDFGGWERRDVNCWVVTSRSGENVLDLFGGSRSTLIAAQQTGHRAFLMELDPLYCDVIVQRFEQFTGQKPERAGSAPLVAA